MRAWDNSFEQSGFFLKNHIAWIKRECSPFGGPGRLRRGHEEIFVYTLKRAVPFKLTEGPFEDVKISALAFDAYSFEGLQRVFSDMRAQLGGKKESDYKTYPRRGAEDYLKKFKNILTSKRFLDHATHRYNFTDVWSFLSENKTGHGTQKTWHPTVKPRKLADRIIEITTNENDWVLDIFSGSGMFSVACKHLGRNSIAFEINEQYHKKSTQKLESDNFLFTGLGRPPAPYSARFERARQRIFSDFNRFKTWEQCAQTIHARRLKKEDWTKLKNFFYGLKNFNGSKEGTEFV
jgi:hypothetical protein